jgi:hypothetical protein
MPDAWPDQVAAKNADPTKVVPENGGKKVR